MIMILSTLNLGGALMDMTRLSAGQLVKIAGLIDDSKCFETVRNLRWAKGIHCPCGGSAEVIKHGHDGTQPDRQRYRCKTCNGCFDDLCGTVFEGHHHPLKSWILCLYFRGLNLSHRQIAADLNLNKDDVQQMTKTLRRGIEAKRPPVQLAGEVEGDEVYLVAGHNGPPAAVEKKGDRVEGGD